MLFIEKKYLRNDFFTGHLTGYRVKTNSASDAEMEGPDSWIQLNICNAKGKCCSSQKLQETRRHQSTEYASDSAIDPCYGMILQKDRPNENGQYVEVEHFGPDGAKIEFINVDVDYKGRLQCTNPVGPGDAIILANGANEKLKLSCLTKIILP